MRKKPVKNSYYKEESYDQEPNSSPDFPIRKIISIAVIILVLLIALALISSLLTQSNNKSIFGSDGGKLASTVSISKNGELIDSFKTDGNKLLLKGNPEERISSTIKTNVTGTGKKNVSIVIRYPNGQIQIISSSPDNEVYIDENGVIHFSIDPLNDLNLEEFYDENTDTYIFDDDDENLDLNFEFVIEDEDTNETTIIDVDGGIDFQQFPQSGCIALSRSSVKEVTHYGSLELNAKLLVSCDSYDDLVSSVAWDKERAGNVEIIFGNYKFASVLSDYNRITMPVPAQGEYDAKIIFTPFKESAGQKASFSVNFGLGTSKAKIDFDIAIDNLEQCIKVSPESMVIPSDQDSTTMTVDASSCHSKSIEVSLCDNDEGCSGGTEGGIDLSQTGFTLSPSGTATKTITIFREEISGAYGIPVYARISGTEKTFIDEKIVIVQPKPEENIVPDKFVVSLIGGARDSITVHNKTLAEDVEVETNICNLYKSSLGIKGDTSLGAGLPSYGAVAQNSWWYDLATNQERYAGQGKYQAALINTLASLDNIRATTQVVSSQKNSLIKEAFLDAGGLKKSANASNNNVTKAITAAEALKDKIEKANEFASLNLAAQVVSLLSSVTSLAVDVAILSTSLDAAETSVKPLLPLCAAAQGNIQSANASLQTANSTTKYFYAEILQGVNMVNQLYTIVNSIMSLSTGDEVIAAENALKNINDASKKIKEANEKIDNSLDYLLLALQSASIDSFVSASNDDAKAADYLSKAKQELLDAKPLIDTALEKVLLATSNITTELPDMANQKRDMIIQATSLLVNVITQWFAIATKVGIIQENVANAGLQLKAALPIATQQCAQCSALNACDDTCCAAEDFLSLAIPQVTEIQYSLASIASKVTSAVDTINTVYQAFEMYQQVQDNYQDELITAGTTFTKTSDSLYALQKDINASLASMDPAIEAAQWLLAQEKNSSEASTFDATDSLVTLEGNFNKKRMIGLIGDAISNGFVNGAYEGGVYTTKNTFITERSSPIRTSSLDEKEKTFLFADDSPSDSGTIDSSATDSSSTGSASEMKEDCANKVKLILPDYVVNLIQDGKQITVTNPNVVVTWSFEDAKVFDVFEEQEVGVVFAGSGLRKSGYGVVEFNYEKHIHEKPSTVSAEFGPFNVPDSKEPLQAKYHFKFNAEPRKGNNYVSFRGNDCTNGLLRGTNGTGTSSNLVLSWDWNSIKPLGNISGSSSAYKGLTSASIGSGSREEPFIDATQLSILISKKIGSLTNFLDSVSTTCPENPAKKVLDSVRPEILNPETGLAYTGEENTLAQDEDSFCYIPLTTKTFEGKPALYYFMENKPLTEWEQWFSDSERVNNAEELLSILDFNVNLVRDGYGTDFQYDFVNNYSKAILKAGPSFLDPSMGAKKYFSDKDRVYFSSQANFLKSNSKWALPDAGKYRVRLLIDFEGSTAKMFNGNAPSAKIIVELYSLEPVNNNYSPWYYTPIDGSVGLSSSNNRRGYGSSISSSGAQFDVSKTQGAFLDSEQKESLTRVSSSSITNFFLLNALPSMHGKILDYSYNYNTKTFRDENSKIVFSPTVATPLLFELHGTAGEETGLVYSVKKDNQQISSDLGNLFLLSYVGDCSDLSGKALSKDFQREPDLKEGKLYGVVLPVAQISGKTFLKTIAYSPIDYSFGLTKEFDEQIYSTNDLKGINNPVALTGITSMPLNDKGSNSVPDSLINVLRGVEKKSICVSSLGSREIFWWPEDSLFEKQGNEGTALSSKETDAKASCVKANSN